MTNFVGVRARARVRGALSSAEDFLCQRIRHASAERYPTKGHFRLQMTGGNDELWIYARQRVNVTRRAPGIERVVCVGVCVCVMLLAVHKKPLLDVSIKRF